MVATAGFTLVLGAGGATGVSYMCGALRALSEIGGLDIAAADAMIGTSAGAAIAADLRLGRSLDEVMTIVLPRPDAAVPAAPDVVPAWASRLDLARRLVGSAWIMSRALPVAWPMPEPPGMLQRLLPNSLFRAASADWALERLGDDWPTGELWIVAFDIDARRRVVLRAGSSDPSPGLRQAALASCAIPGIFPPVRVDGRRLVDGGVRSATNLDLARATGSQVVIALAPLGFDPRRPPSRPGLMRVRTNMQLRRECSTLRPDRHVLLLRPTGDQLQLYGRNPFTRRNSQQIMDAAFEATAQQLAGPEGRAMLEAASDRARTG